MADFEIIEADFQEYYSLNVAEVPFRRFVRLLTNLPLSSRFVMKYNPTKDWDFSKETESRILHQLEAISCQLYNLFKKKGAKARKPDEQFQPDYVKKAKEEYQKSKKPTEDEMDDAKEFWMRKNKGAKFLEDEKDGD